MCTYTQPQQNKYKRSTDLLDFGENQVIGIGNIALSASVEGGVSEQHDEHDHPEAPDVAAGLVLACAKGGGV